MAPSGNRTMAADRGQRAGMSLAARRPRVRSTGHSLLERHRVLQRLHQDHRAPGAKKLNLPLTAPASAARTSTSSSSVHHRAPLPCRRRTMSPASCYNERLFTQGEHPHSVVRHSLPTSPTSRHHAVRRCSLETNWNWQHPPAGYGPVAVAHAAGARLSGGAPCWTTASAVSRARTTTTRSPSKHFSRFTMLGRRSCISLGLSDADHGCTSKTLTTLLVPARRVSGPLRSHGATLCISGATGISTTTAALTSIECAIDYRGQHVPDVQPGAILGFTWRRPPTLVSCTGYSRDASRVARPIRRRATLSAAT